MTIAPFLIYRDCCKAVFHLWKAMDWDDAKILLAIGRTGGLSRTAKLLGISTSTVHRRATELEQALGAVIFARRPDGYALTEVGQRFFALAQQAEEHLTAMERQDFQGEQELFRIALPELLGQQLILPELARLKRREPKLRLEFSTNVAPVEFHRREADIVVRFVRPTGGPYTVQHIGRAGFGLYCSPGYADRQKVALTKEHLSEHSIIGWDPNLQYVFLARWLNDLTQGAAPAVSFDSLQSQFLMAQAGSGIALLPEFSCQGSALVRVCPEIHYHQDIWLMRHQDIKNSSYAGKICQSIREALTD